jgi:streptogramin lyase
MRMWRTGVLAVLVLAWATPPAHATVPIAQEFPLTSGAHPADVTGFEDGWVWFTEPGIDKVGRIAPWGALQELTTGAGVAPTGIAVGPDAALWTTEDNLSGKTGRISGAADHAFTEVTTGVNGQGAPAGTTAIVAGADGNLWYLSPTAHALAYGVPGAVPEQHLISDTAQPVDAVAGPDLHLYVADATGDVTDYGRSSADTQVQHPLGAGTAPHGITEGPDGTVWFTESGSDRVGHLVEGTPVTFITSAGSHPEDIAVGADGNLWFTEPGLDRIGRVTPVGVVTEFSAGISAGAHPTKITAGPDGNLWFTEPGRDRIGRINTAVDAPTSGNLLRNPGAETAGPAGPADGPVPIPGWVTSPSLTSLPYGALPDLPDADQALLDGGSRLFAGGPANARSTAVQAVDVGRASNYAQLGFGALLDTYAELAGQPADVSSAPSATFAGYSAEGGPMGVSTLSGIVGNSTTHLARDADVTAGNPRWVIVQLQLRRAAASTGYNVAAADSLGVQVVSPPAPPPPPTGCPFDPHACPVIPPQIEATASASGRSPTHYSLNVATNAAGTLAVDTAVGAAPLRHTTYAVPVGTSVLSVPITGAMRKDLYNHGDRKLSAFLGLTTPDRGGAVATVTLGLHAAIAIRPSMYKNVTPHWDAGGIVAVVGSERTAWTTPVTASHIRFRLFDSATHHTLTQYDYTGGQYENPTWKKPGRHSTTQLLYFDRKELVRYYKVGVPVSVTVTITPKGSQPKKIVETVKYRRFKGKVDRSDQIDKHPDKLPGGVIKLN